MSCFSAFRDFPFHELAPLPLEPSSSACQNTCKWGPPSLTPLRVSTVQVIPWRCPTPDSALARPSAVVGVPVPLQRRLHRARAPGFDLGVMFTKDGHMQLGNIFSQRQHAACACKQTPITPARNCFQDQQPRVKI